MYSWYLKLVLFFLHSSIMYICWNLKATIYNLEAHLLHEFIPFTIKTTELYDAPAKERAVYQRRI